MQENSVTVRLLFFGNFVACKNTYTKENQHYELLELLKDFFADYDKPVIYGMESGHKKPYMFTLPLGAKCSINLQNKENTFWKVEFILDKVIFTDTGGENNVFWYACRFMDR